MRITAALTLSVLALAAPLACAQARATGQPALQPAQQPPSNPAAAKPTPRAQWRPADTNPKDPPLNAYLTYSEPQSWTSRTQVDVTAFEFANQQLLEIQSWKIDALAMIFPAIRETASTTGDLAKIRGELRVADRVYTTDYSILQGYHSDAIYTRWDAQELQGIREISLVVESEVRSWETTLNEQAAGAVAWPEGDWPTEARSTFGPQFGVDFTEIEGKTNRLVADLVNKWTEGRDPKSIPPLQLAKYFTGRVAELVQPVAPGLQRGRTAQRRGFEGLRLLGVDRTIRGARGSPFDIACVLASVLREAGLPARIVVGLRQFDEYDTNDFTIDELVGVESLHAYVEFFLYDEKTGDQGWIPVDPVQIRRQSSRSKPLDQPWEFFGTHDELDHFIPLAFHFHPPTTVRAYGSPGLWGWYMSPMAPDTAFQQLTFSTFNTPVRGGE